MFVTYTVSQFVICIILTKIFLYMMVCILHWNLSKKATGYWNLCFLKVINLTRAIECGFINDLICIFKYSVRTFSVLKGIPSTGFYPVWFQHNILSISVLYWISYCVFHIAPFFIKNQTEFPLSQLFSSHNIPLFNQTDNFRSLCPLPPTPIAHLPVIYPPHRC